MRIHKRYMRILVFFDLPVRKQEERRIYGRFRKFLLNDGYDMLQFSIYSRFCTNLTDVEKHEKRLNANLPQLGSVRSMVVTDKQFGEMRILVGQLTQQEEFIGSKQLLLF